MTGSEDETRVRVSQAKPRQDKQPRVKESRYVIKAMRYEMKTRKGEQVLWAARIMRSLD